MNYIQNARLVIAGSGDILTKLQQLVINEKLQNKVEFTGRLPLEELGKLTPQADLGLSIEEDLGLNYRFALPNKLFDYIQALGSGFNYQLTRNGSHCKSISNWRNYHLARTTVFSPKNY